MNTLPSNSTWFIMMKLASTACVVFLIAFGCSSPDPVQPDEVPGGSADAATPNAGEGDGDEGDAADGLNVSAGSSPQPTLSDDDLFEVIDLEAGEQIEDAQGNLIAIYGYQPWPETFAALTPEHKIAFPFFGDVEALADPDSALVAIDVAMCAAGLDSEGVGTVEFFLHKNADEPLSADAVLNRGVLARHPVLSPSFDLPASAKCSRGWLPVLWAGGEEPGVARYVLSNRRTGQVEVERHLYQWTIEQVDAPDLDAAVATDFFRPGQTITFNDGLLDQTTVVVDGWSELIGSDSPIAGTRLIAVSLTVCLATPRWPEFGIALDGWNITAPLDPTDQLGAELSEVDPDALAGGVEPACYDGWLEFAAPLGAVPTGFFASDGRSVDVGYAEWSLEGAALPVPQ